MNNLKKYKPQNRYELLELVKNKSIYLGDICTSAITDMGNLFLRAKRKNFSGIEYWDTSNVITMEGMFAECKHFDIPIGCWDVSKVKDMSFMFYGCATFNQPLNDWDVSSVENTESMFNGARAFNQPLDSWKPANLKNQHCMFHDCESFTYSLGNQHKEPVCYMAILSVK